MAWKPRTMVLPGLAIVLTFVGVPRAFGQNAPPEPPAPSTPSAPASAPSPQIPAAAQTINMFAGVWTYNEAESLNAATGRQERSPKSATQRTPVRGVAGGASAANPGRPSVSPSSDTNRSTLGMGPSMAPGLTGQLGPTVAMIQENRSLTRDLLEVPESLMISASPGEVTFVDDLDRTRSFQTTGEKARYQIGAARFNAATEWNGQQLVKKIDAADGFRMTETYFLSEDGKRLFVIVRVGTDRKGAPIMGVNRVYDRVDP